MLLNLSFYLRSSYLSIQHIFDDDPPPIVAGARLCSVRSCTYIIPPSSEYPWKMCALCRLRARPNQSNNSIAKIAVGQPSIYYMAKPNSKASCRSVFLSEINSYLEGVKALTVACSYWGQSRHWIAISVLQGVRGL